MRFKWAFLVVLMLSVTNARGQALGALGVSSAYDTGTYFAGTHNVSGSFSTYRWSYAALKASIIGSSISGSLWNVPVFYNSNSVGTSYLYDSGSVLHSGVRDTLTVWGKLYLKNVPAAVNGDSILVLGNVNHTVRAVRPPVSGPDIWAFWPLDSFALTTTGTAGTYGDATHIPTITTDTKGRVTAVTVNTFTATPGGTAGGDLTGTYPNPTLGTAGTAGTYGNATHIPIITTDTKGRVTAVTVATFTATPGGGAGGDLTGSYPNPTLGTAGTAGTYGDATHIPTITTDSKGRVTAVTVATFTATPGGGAGGDLTGSYPNPTLGSAGTAGTYGDATHIPTITTDAKGRVSAVTVATFTATPGGGAGGDLTGSYPNPTLGTAGTAGTYGDATHIPTITTDAKGRVTAVTVATFSPTPGGGAGGDLTGSYPNPTLGAAGTAGTYGDATHIPTITTDAKGRVTAVTVATFTATPGGGAGGDLTGSYPNPTLGTAGTAGTYGDATHIPTITTDAKGRVTAVTVATFTATPGGGAGGDLTGSYPNPTLGTAGTAGTYGDATHIPTITTDTKGRVTAVTVNTFTATPSIPCSPQTITLSSSPATYAINSGFADTRAPMNVNITAQANALTLSAPTGSWVINQFLMITIADNGTSEPLSWNSAFVAGTTTNAGVLPSATVTGKTQTLVFRVQSSSLFHFVGYSVN